MAKYFVFIIFSALVLTACDDTPQRVLPKGKKPIIAEKEYPKERESAIDIPPPPAPYTGPKKFCFEMELGNNTNEITRMQFVLHENDSISGFLTYSFPDRAPIHGTIDGIKEGKLIEMNYAYIDSGKHKTEEMVMKLEDRKLYKKTGALVEENGILVLENPRMATLQLFMMQVDCNK